MRGRPAITVSEAGRGEISLPLPLSLNRDFMAVTRLIFTDKIPAHVSSPRCSPPESCAVNRAGHFF